MPRNFAAIAVISTLLLVSGCGKKPDEQQSQPAAQSAPQSAQSQPAPAPESQTGKSSPGTAAPAAPPAGGQTTVAPPPPAKTPVTTPSTPSPSSPPATEQKAKPPAQPIILRGAPMGGVRFEHAKHPVACATCHHPSRAEKPATAPQQACTSCHTKPAQPGMKTVKQAAFHDPAAASGTCIDCHKKSGGAAPTKCLQCHKKENV